MNDAGDRYYEDEFTNGARRDDTLLTRLVNRWVVPMVSGLFIALVLYFLLADHMATDNKQRLLEEQKVLEEQYALLEARFDQTIQVLNDIRVRDTNLYLSIFEQEVLPRAQENRTLEEIAAWLDRETLVVEDLTDANRTRLHQLLNRMGCEHLCLDSIDILIQSLDFSLAQTPSVLPLKDIDFAHNNHGYGHAIDKVSKQKVFHAGLDFPAPVGTAVFATASGTVESTLNEHMQHGNAILLKHTNGYQTFYAHLQLSLVNQGDSVSKGQFIGVTGQTGKSAEPHLHYEVRRDGQPLNPINFFFEDLSPDDYARLHAEAQSTQLSLD